MTGANKNNIQKRKQRRQRIVAVSALVLLILIVFSLLEYHWLENPSPVVLALLNFNAILLMLLVVLIFRNLIKLFVEHSQQHPGSRFRTKLVLAFIFLTLIPTLLLAFIGTNLMANAIKNWFDPQVGQFVDDAMDIARLSHKQFESQTTNIAEISSHTLQNTRNLASEDAKAQLRDLFYRYSPDVIQLFSKDGKELFRISGEVFPTGIFLNETSASLPIYLQNETFVEVIPAGTSEIIRVGKQVNGVDSQGSRGVVVVSLKISGPLSSRIRSIQSNYEAYRQQKQLIRPTQGLYVSIFLLIALTILFAAVWVSLYFARQISEPILHLSNATRELAKGNYDYRLDIQALDELGDLVRSFNLMIEEIRGNRNLIEKTAQTLQEKNREMDARRHELEVILSTIKAGVIAFDMDGSIRVINASACAFFGLDSRATINNDYTRAFDSQTLRPVVDILDRIYVDKYKVFQNEVQLDTGSRLSTFSINVTPVYDNTGSFNGVVMVLNDLTHLLRMQRIAAWREVARRLAHEIKNPLTPIQLNTQRLQKKFQEKAPDFPVVFKSATESIITEVKGLQKLLGEFSQFARMPESSLSPGNVNKIIESAIALYEGKQDVVIDSRLQTNIPAVLLDASQLKRVFINLIDNAVDSMNEEGTITIESRQDKRSGRVMIKIQDEGCGVSARDKSKLFLPYFSTKGSGSGLGLAICSRIISDHDGSIRVDDNQPRGTVFTIELPIAPGEQDLSGEGVD